MPKLSLNAGVDDVGRVWRNERVTVGQPFARAKALAFLVAITIGASIALQTCVGAEAVSASEPASTLAGRRTFVGLASVVAYNVEPVRQPSSMSCWAAVYTMMRSWREGRDLTIADAVAGLGDPYPAYLAKDDGLPGGAERDFVERAGMMAMPPASYPLSEFRRLLRGRGPVWITAGDGITAHARLLVGIYSPDESESAEAYERSMIEFIDPEDGTFRYESAIEFVREFEREAVFIVEGRMDNIPLRWQIIAFRP